ncbi:hypothetical protein JHK82_012251 [Glycine max]|nr:hypothetical protein JHK85_012590 [Glycine max]KAG5057257.1 hypothetical protein JHK86_012253 [Glycine max]KAG5154282.1 hypothetical protein JHK82_012251 [Glycine max]
MVTPTLGLNLSLLRRCNSFVILAIVSLPRYYNPLSPSTRCRSSTRDAVNSSLFSFFFELKLSRLQFLLLLLLRFLKGHRSRSQSREREEKSLNHLRRVINTIAGGFIRGGINPMLNRMYCGDHLPMLGRPG